MADVDDINVDIDGDQNEAQTTCFQKLSEIASGVLDNHREKLLLTKNVQNTDFNKCLEKFLRRLL